MEVVMIMCILFIGMLLIWECSKLVLNKTIEHLTIKTINDKTNPTTVRDYAQKLHTELDNPSDPSQSRLAQTMRASMKNLMKMLNKDFLKKFERMYDDRNGSPNSCSKNENSLWSLINPVNVRINEYSNEVKKLKQKLNTHSADSADKQRKVGKTVGVAKRELRKFA